MKYLIEQTISGVVLGLYEAEDADQAIQAMLQDAGYEPGELEPDPGLVAREVPDNCATVEDAVAYLTQEV